MRKAQKQLKDLKKKMGEMELAHNQQIKRKDDELTELNSIITRETQLFQEKDMELQVKYWQSLRNTQSLLRNTPSFISQ